MRSAYHQSLLVFAVAAASCQTAPSESAPAPVLTGDCEALVSAARRASSCDERLDQLATRVLAHPDERVCRQQARHLLRPPPAASRIRSVYEEQVDEGREPLTPEEKAALAELELPGILMVKPDLPRAPGLPMTTVRLGNRDLDVRSDGTFLAFVPPGPHTLTVRQAGEEGEVCVALAACERVELTAHGSQFAPHKRANPGACGEPGLEVVSRDP